MSKEFDSAWLMRRLAKSDPSAEDHPVGLSKAEEYEVDLHEKITAECKRLGWYVVHSRMDKRATVAVGTPDYVVVPKNAQVFFVECKSKTGKQKTKQRDAQYWIEMLGHKYYVVRSIEEFRAIRLENKRT